MVWPIEKSRASSLLFLFRFYQENKWREITWCKTKLSRTINFLKFSFVKREALTNKPCNTQYWHGISTDALP